jgi:hypothetical protein
MLGRVLEPAGHVERQHSSKPSFPARPGRPHDGSRRSRADSEQSPTGAIVFQETSSFRDRPWASSCHRGRSVADSGRAFADLVVFRTTWSLDGRPWSCSKRPRRLQLDGRSEKADPWKTAGAAAGPVAATSRTSPGAGNPRHGLPRRWQDRAASPTPGSAVNAHHRPGSSRSQAPCRLP